MTQRTPEGLIVFYDGSCPLCTSEIKFLKRLVVHEQVTWTDVSKACSDLVYDGLPLSCALSRFHVRDDRGRLLSGPLAFAELWKQIPRWRWAGVLAALPGIRHFLEIGYRLFLCTRPAAVRLFILVKKYRRPAEDRCNEHGVQ